MSNVAAVANAVIKYRNNQVFSALATPGSEIVELVQNEPQIIWWANEAIRNKALRKFATPLAATLHIGAGQLNDKAVQFITQWRDGIDLRAGSPILVLRQRVLSGNLPFRSYDRLYLAVSAWNAFAQGRAIQKVQTMRGDQFPRITGE